MAAGCNLSSNPSQPNPNQKRLMIQLEIPDPETEPKELAFMAILACAFIINISVWAYATGNILNSLARHTQ